MGPKILILLAVVLLLGQHSLAQGSNAGSCSNSPSSSKEGINKQQCSVDVKERVDCGFPGISAEECHSRGCCFDSSVPEVKWCFFPKQTDKPQCRVNIKEREDCGFPGISAKECYSRGCCFNSSVPEVKWCFYPKNPAPSDKNQCNVDPSSRRDCGHPGISATECRKRKCCFDSSIPGVNWCFFSKLQDKQQCSVDVKEREDCGFPGISAKECYSRGCCFNSSVPEVKWCFYPKNPAPSDKSQCNVDPSSRRDCGHPGISATECRKRKCCFDSSIPGVNWCFFSKLQDKQQCSVDVKEREDCGFPGISAKECYSRGCCFNSSVPEVKWCFYPKNPAPSDKSQCNVDPSSRRDCGHPGISATECRKRKCCFDSSIPGVNWCFFSKLQDKQQCSVDVKEREDCGFPGISPKECYSRGCCFNSSVPDVKWCFYAKTPALSEKNQCNVDPSSRRDCGYPGISAAECKKKNCCFDSSIPGVNWCFFSKLQDKQQCSVDVKEREDCGFPGISAEECYSRGCCFNSSVPEVKWCFYPKNPGCSVNPKLRRDCGYPNITPKDCLSRGCCFDDSIPETAWCFYGYK